MKQDISVNDIGRIKSPYSVSYQNLIAVAIPLMVQGLVITIMTLADRIMMSHYDVIEFAALTPAFAVGFTIAAFFNGIVFFVSTLVAQYYGSGDQHTVKVTVWQGIYFSLFSCCFLAGAMPFVSKIFQLFGHSKDLIVYETIYVNYILVTMMTGFFMGSMGGYFSGRGRTRVMMWGAIAGNLTNLGLDFWFIFGGLGIPAMGIAGAGLATLFGGVISLLVVFSFFIYDGLYGPGRKLRLLMPVFDGKIMKKLLYFGMPSAIQLGMDTGGFALMLMFMGQLGSVPTAAAGMTLSLQLFSYLPILNIATACGILVGHERGARQFGNIKVLVKKTMVLGISLSVLITAIFLLWPDVMMLPFLSHLEAVEMKEITVYFRAMLMISCAWLILEAILNVYLHVLKSLGDTMFIMIAFLVLIPITFILPAWIATKFFGDPILLYLTTLFYIFALLIVFALRYHSGGWKNINIISGQKNYKHL